MFAAFYSTIRRVSIVVLVLILLIPSLGHASVMSSTFTVNTTADTSDASPGDGLCADAGGSCSLRAAIEETNALTGADTINLPAGSYLLANGQLEVSDGLTLNGSGAETTIVDGQEKDRVFMFDATISIAGITVQNGKIGEVGGGIFLSSGELILTNVVVKNNTTVYGYPYLTCGGGIFNDGQLTLIGTTVSGNTAYEEGGGICNWGSLTLDHSTISANDTAKEGGGLYNEWTVEIIRSTITGNAAATNGGGISNVGGELTITQSTLSDNHAQTGGGLYNKISWGYGSATLTESAVSGNSATYDGGGIYNFDSSLTIIASTVSENTATGSSYSDGGGILSYDDEGNARLWIEQSTLNDNQAYNGGGLVIAHGQGDATVLNTTLSGNTSKDHGGGIYMYQSYLRLEASTIVNNTADDDGNGNGDGGGIYLYDSYTNLDFRNTILAGNSDSGGQSPECGGSGNYNSQDYNLIQNTTGCTIGGTTTHNITGQSPNLGALGDNGGATFTHALLTGSPAIDSGACTGSDGNPILQDQRGEPRPMGPLCDMGAYEYPGLALTKAVNDVEAEAGQIVNFTIVARNGRPTNVTKASISDTLPSNLTFVGPITLDPPGAGLPGTTPPLLASNITLAGGGQVTVSFPAMVNNDVSAGTWITNTASIDSPDVGAPTTASTSFHVCVNHATVSNAADSGAGSLREAIANACPDGSIDFALSPLTTITLTGGELAINKPLTITGPGADQLAISGNDSSRVFNVSGNGVTISGLTIRDGYGLTPGGGGIFNTGSLTLFDMVFTENHGFSYLPDTGGGGGGGIYNSAELTVRASTFTDNTADAYGGGGGAVCNEGGAVTILDSLIENNSVTDFYGYGGGVFNGAYDGVMTIINSTIRGNIAENSGGGLNNFDGDLTIIGSTINDNSTVWYDGGGLNNVGDLTISNSTFSGNYAANDGGAIWLTFSYGSLDNVTLTGDVADGQGNEIFVDSNWITMRNVILASGALGSNCAGEEIEWDFISLGYNLSTDGSCNLTDPTDLPNTDPLLGLLANNGGPTLTHTLLENSPAIDKGSCTDSNNVPVMSDQRGIPRPLGLTCDIGAVEVGDYFSTYLPLVRK